MPLPERPEPLTIYIEGPSTVEKSHLAETLQDLLLHLGYQVSPDPNHGLFTPAALRSRPANTPVIHIVEYDEAVEDAIQHEESIVAQFRMKQ